LTTREHPAESTHFRQGQKFTGDSFSQGNISSPGLTLKRVPTSLRMVALDRTHTTSYYTSTVTLAVSLTVSVLQSTLCRNDLAGRL